MSQKVTPEVLTFTFTLVDIITLLTGLVSIILGIFAIWLTLYLKKTTDSINKETKELLMEIKVDAKSVASGVISEMEKWGDFGRTALTSTSEHNLSGGVSKANEAHSDVSNGKHENNGVQNS